MQIADPDRIATRRPRQHVRYAALALVVGTFAAGCTSSRHSSSAVPGATSTADATGTSRPRTSSNDTAAVTTPSPTTTAPTTAAPTTTTATLPPTTTVPPTTTTSPPTTTTTPLVTAGAIVLVANATNIPGGAGRLSNTLTKVGYQTAAPTNAAGIEEFLDTTKVYFLPAGEAVATGLATVLGVPLAHMPTPAPITDATAGLGDATVLVMLGKDLAGKTPPGLKGR